MRPPEHFKLDPLMKWMFFIAPVIFFGFAMLGVALLLLAGDDHPRKVAFERGLGAVLTLMFGGAAWFSWRLLPDVKFAAVSLDDEGIWQQSKPRASGLVRWHEIARVRERPLLQRLELHDRTGALLMKLEYQLHEFERLRAIVLSRSALTQSNEVQPSVYSKGLSHHVFNIAAIFGFTALGLFVFSERPLIGALLVVGVVGMGGWEYLSTVYRLELRDKELVVYRPGRPAVVRREEVNAIEIGDVHANFARYPQVVIHTHGQSGTVKLRNLGVQAVALQQALLRWKSGAV